MDKHKYDEHLNSYYEEAKSMSLYSLKESLASILRWSETWCCSDSKTTKEFDTHAIAEIMGFIKYLEEVVEHADRPS